MSTNCPTITATIEEVETINGYHISATLYGFRISERYADMSKAAAMRMFRQMIGRRLRGLPG